MTYAYITRADVSLSYEPKKWANQPTREQVNAQSGFVDTHKRTRQGEKDIESAETNDNNMET